MTPEMVKKANSLRSKTEVVKGWSLGWRKNLDKTKVKVGRLLEIASKKRVWTLGSELLRKAPGPEKGFRSWQGFIDKVQVEADKERDTMHCSDRKEAKASRL
jgi:hypothetical protein